jgi:hypothetical protein
MATLASNITNNVSFSDFSSSLSTHRNMLVENILSASKNVPLSGNNFIETITQHLNILSEIAPEISSQVYKEIAKNLSATDNGQLDRMMHSDLASAVSGHSCNQVTSDRKFKFGKDYVNFENIVDIYKNEKPQLFEILKNYQVPDDKMVKNLRYLSVEMTSKESKLLDNLVITRGLNGLKVFNDIKKQATSAADLNSPPVNKQQIPERVKQNMERILGASDLKTSINLWPKNNGHNDAFRHAYWSARMTQEFGPQFSKAFTTAHEGVPGNEQAREAMDLYNNEVGRKIAIMHPKASEKHLQSLIRNALDNGDLIVINQDGKLRWSNRVENGQHGWPEPKIGKDGKYIIIKEAYPGD